MKLFVTRSKKLALILSVALAASIGLAAPMTASAANSGNNQAATTIWQNSGIPDGCPGNPHAGTRSNCPQLAQKEKDLNCSSNQTPTKLISGPKSGSWYCNGGSSPSGAGGGSAAGGAGGGGSATGSASGGIGQGTGCTGSSCGQQCGAPDQDPYTPAIDIGCQGKGNPIMDAFFGIVRFLSDGVGLVVIGSIIVGGIQYSGSRGDPQSTAMAINRIRSSLYALLIYIFAYAILNYIIPGAVLQ